MENIIGVMVEKYRKHGGVRSLEHIYKILDGKELDEWEIGSFQSVQEKNDFIILNIICGAYQDGISAGKKLSDKSDLNEIDAITFAIKKLSQVKDDLKVAIATELFTS